SSFQRLRRILQTGYTPLYPSTLHNRFVHSLGVYHLGKIAIDFLRSNSNVLFQNFEKGVISNLCSVFEIACLLHDVGHAPFSHTGEIFYLDEQQKYTQLHQKLSDLLKSPVFDHDIEKYQSLVAAPHEIMSAIIGITEFSEFLIDDELKEFFVRCIVGYQYSKNCDELHQIKNCFISLLNSKVIDVDKLDYLIRDAHSSGFDTVNIDYVRLLGSLVIVKNAHGKYEIAYNKNAISVIENVIYAHDSERKWIQSHPSVLYESYLLKNIITNINSEFQKFGFGKLFSQETLSNQGVSFKHERFGKIRMRLLCDDDIIFFMKNVFESPMSSEYFERTERRRPIWKSETEYKSHILSIADSGSVISNLEETLSQICSYVSKSTDKWFLDNNLIERFRNEMSNIENSEEMRSKQGFEQLIRPRKRMLAIMEILQKLASEHGFPCSFVILESSQFMSGFAKPDFNELKIALQYNKQEKESGIRLVHFSQITSSLHAKEKARDKFFYIYHKRSNQNKEIDITKFAYSLFRSALM
ncbi:MAG: HD domain-containing protein, partial [Bacillota bacterium]|nr:HD domain-containing protein [Bacillota bacterium]